MIKNPLSILRKNNKYKTLWIAMISTVGIISVHGCTPQVKEDLAVMSVSDAEHSGNTTRSAEDLRIVDCHLPAEVIRVGQNSQYTTPRRPVRTTAWDCKVKQGEHIPQGRRLLEIWIAEALKYKPQTQTYVGDIYAQGLGTDQDYAKAAEWYRKAALQGYKQAQTRLAYLYETGLGVNQDYEVAQHWYRLSAN